MVITDYPITTHFGEIDRVHSKPHSGLDLACKTGTKIYSQDSGTVHLTVDQYLGNTVRLKLDNGVIVVYGHLSKINVTEGQYVDVGTCLAETGGAVGSKNSGLTTGEHLHCSVYNSSGTLIDPYNYLFNHENIEENTTGNSFLFPMILIILLFILWKCKKIVIYGLGIIFLLSIVFIAS